MVFFCCQCCAFRDVLLRTLIVTSGYFSFCLTSDLFTQKTDDYWIFFLTLETLEIAVWENPHTSLFGTNNHGTLKYS